MVGIRVETRANEFREKYTVIESVRKTCSDKRYSVTVEKSTRRDFVLRKGYGDAF